MQHFLKTCALQQQLMGGVKAYVCMRVRVSVCVCVCDVVKQKRRRSHREPLHSTHKKVAQAEQSGLD